MCEWIWCWQSRVPFLTGLVQPFHKEWFFGVDSLTTNSWCIKLFIQCISLNFHFLLNEKDFTLFFKDFPSHSLSRYFHMHNPLRELEYISKTIYVFGSWHICCLFVRKLELLNFSLTCHWIKWVFNSHDIGIVALERLW